MDQPLRISGLLFAFGQRVSGRTFSGSMVLKVLED
jgi:hypothetical protein